MARKVFRSRVDWWLRPVLALVIVGEFFAIGSVIMNQSDPVLTTVIILVCLAGLALFLSLLLGTHYAIDRGVLVIRSGPFRWKVPIDSITGVEATRSPLSSPALSLDRLRIRYGKRHQIMISPADKDGFLRAIGREVDNRERPAGAE